jgi:steroid 5-alpha reductase family enzyme
MILLIQNAVFQIFNSNGTDFEQLSNTLFLVMIFIALGCFIVGELTKNYSQVDKIWSILPIVYSLITLFKFSSSPRILLMTILVTAWGLRLTYNFSRKGGYSVIPWKGEEDYRWNILRQNPKLKGFRIVLFNLFFISLYQNFLIFLFSTPLLLAAKYTNTSLNGLDYLATFFMLLFLCIETIADNQLFNFHLQKQHKIPETSRFANSLKVGFMTDGLWKYVRHPNFISEQLIWVSFYLFSVAASGQWINWTLSGSVLLILLFIGSSDFTESISIEKYPEYIDYKLNMPRYFPYKFNLNQDKYSKNQTF